MADHNIQIDVKLKDDNALSVLKQIRDTMNDLKRQSSVELKADTDKLARRLNAMRQDLARYAEAFSEIGTSAANGFDALNSKLDEINHKEVAPKVDSSELDEAASKAERLASGLNAAAGIASSLSSIFSGLGNFGGMFADSFGAMSSMFKFDAVGTASRYLTAMATRAVTSQISGIIERYDIMNTFVPYMELAGVDQSTAQDSLNRVDQSIRGIPIGLDEAAFRLRKYQMYMNDIDRATNFTIGIQKAITAGGASEQMKTTAYTQIDRLLATGKLGQSRQWLSLFNGLGVSLRFLREELALDPTADLKQIAGDLANGTIATDDFLRAIERLADNEGLDQALEIYKGTIGAWKANIDNATKRGGQGIMESVDAVLEDTYGRGITGFMKNVRDGIDIVSKDASAYIQNNPQHVQTIGTAISGLLDRVMTLDGGRFVDNVVKNVSGLLGAIGTVFDSLPPGFLEDFTAFATTWAGPMATVMKAAQSGLGVVLGVFDRMKDFDMANLMGKITREIERMAKAVSTILDLIPDGLLGDLMAFGLVWGKPLASVLGSISNALKDMSGVAASGGSFSAANGIFGQLYSIASAHPMLAAAAAAIGAIAIGIKSVYDAQAEYDQNSRQQLGLSRMEEDLQKITSLSDGFATTYREFEDNIALIRGSHEEASKLVDEVFDLYEKLEQTDDKHERHTILQELAEDIAQLQTLAPGVDLSQLLHGELDSGAAAELRDLAHAYVDFINAQAEADATQNMLTEAYETKRTAELQKRQFEKDRRNLMQERSEAQREFERMQRYANTYGNPTQVDRQGITQTIYDKDYNKILDQADNRATMAKNAIPAAEQGIKDSTKAMEEADDTIKILSPDLATLNSELEQTANTDWTPLTGGAKEAGEELSEAEQHALDMLDDFRQIREEARAAMESAIGGFEKIDNTVQPQALSITTSNIASNNEVGNYFQDQVEILHDWVESNLLTEEGQKFLEENGAAIQALIDQAETDFGQRGLLYGLVDAITGGEGTAEELNSYFSEQLENAGIKDTVSGLMADIEAMLKYGSGWEEEKKNHEGEDEFAWMKEGIQNNVITPLVEMAQELSESGETGAAITESVGQLAQGITQAIQPVEDGFTGAIDKSHGLESAITNLSGTASAQAGGMQSFAGSLDSVASSAANAFSNVSALAAAISRLQDKTVTIRVNVLGSLGRAAHGGMAGYFASGGNVLDGFPGMGSGSDIIPAWLTPGEYVMRRAAVGMFGSHFMDRVNKMDIGGAFDALMSRISNPMHMGGNTYNRDNHATVNNYFYGDNGQNYSQHKAYRYVGAL